MHKFDMTYHGDRFDAWRFIALGSIAAAADAVIAGDAKALRAALAASNVAERERKNVAPLPVDGWQVGEWPVNAPAPELLERYGDGWRWIGSSRVREFAEKRSLAHGLEAAKLLGMAGRGGKWWKGVVA